MLTLNKSELVPFSCLYLSSIELALTLKYLCVGTYLGLQWVT